jgi:lactoylglutathione lyase
LEVDSVDALLSAKARLQAGGIDVVGPTDHTIFKSIYFFDPNGHRLELAANTASAEMMNKLDQVKYAMLEEWTKIKRAPKHAAWMHQGSRTESTMR